MSVPTKRNLISLNFSKLLTLVLFCQINLGCERHNVKSNVTQAYLKHKLDSLIAATPKSIKMNDTDSTVIIEYRDGTKIKKKQKDYFKNRLPNTNIKPHNASDQHAFYHILNNLFINLINY
jgi:hypothetical protein